MNISKDLQLSILAMDSYNQGYGRGIVHNKTQIGSASIDTDSEEVFRDPNADLGAESVAQAAGFYAVSYTIGAGVEDLDQNSTVISYRGTDNTHGNGEGGNDIWEGWTIGAGDISSWISCFLIQSFQGKNFSVWRAI